MQDKPTLDLSVIEPRLFSALMDIAVAVKSAGGRAMMVGGSVRDLLLGAKAIKDVDLEVFSLAPDKLMRIIAAKYDFDKCGVSFGVLKIRNFPIDVSLPRRETKRGEGHRAFLVDSDPSLSVKEAAERRDFTINAMYYDPVAGDFADPYGGVGDLRRGVLRHVSAKFAEDPLRVLRAMQFVARFELDVAPETVAICREMQIEDLPAERLFSEWEKLLVQGVGIARGLEFLRACTWVRYFPELSALIGCRQDPQWHPEGDVWEHTKLCLDAFARRRTGNRQEDLIVGLAVLCHDFGKPSTTRFDKKAGRLRSLGHDESGVGPTISFLRRLTCEERLLRDVPPLVQCHMQPYALWKAKAGDSAIRRLAARVGRIDRLLRVARADQEGRGGWQEREGDDELRYLSDAAERLRVADSAPKPILMGRHLIALGYRPSPRFQRWLAAAFEAQLDGAFADLDGALDYFRRKLA